MAAIDPESALQHDPPSPKLIVVEVSCWRGARIGGGGCGRGGGLGPAIHRLDNFA